MKTQTQSFTARIPVPIATRIKALAQANQVSEAYVAVRVLEAGFQALDQAVSKLPQIQNAGLLSPLLLSVPANFGEASQ
jgi:hypothetical protein